MRIGKWMLALAALLACGLIAVGCGDDEDEPSSSSDTPAAESSDSSESPDDTSAEGSTPEDVLAACEDALEGTGAEEAGQAGCQAAADAFEQCLSQAEALDDDEAKETALTACQDGADQAVEALKAAPTGGG